MNKLAIIIPYYKITFFEECLNSIAEQTNKNFNIYIGNDNSPNDPVYIINRYIDKLSIVYKKFEENLGKDNLVKQWDRCIEMSQNEEWIMILGDDDTLENNVVEEFYNNLPRKEDNIQLIRLASRMINENGEATSKIYYNPEKELAKDFFFRCLDGDARCTLTEHIFTRKTYNKNKFKNFPVGFGSDNVAWLEFSDMKYVKAINSTSANIRMSGENISGIQDRTIGFKRVEAYHLYYKYIIENLHCYFNKNEMELILNKSYSYLRIFNRETFKAGKFILFMIYHIGFKRTLQIIQNNRYKKEID